MNDGAPAQLNPNDVGSRIRSARRRAHLAQAELARRVGIGAAPMNNIEQGRNLASTPVIAAIASEVGVSVDALLWGYGQEAVRSATSTSDSEVREGRVSYGAPAEAVVGMRVMRPDALRSVPETCARLDDVARAYLALEDICGVMKSSCLPLSLPFECDDDGVTALVSRVRTFLGIGEGVIFDYLELMENTGLRVVFLDLPSGMDSVGCYDEACANVMFFVRCGMNPERQLFRLLFELGWIYGHVQDERMHSGRHVMREGALDHDHMARKFAALFLMPESAVRATVRQLGIQPGDWTYPLLLRIKHRFGISAQAFNLRLLELGLITDARQAELRERIEQHYKETDYAEPDSTRRVLSPNGRLGDLLLCAKERHRTGEVKAIARVLKGLPGVTFFSHGIETREVV